MARYIDADMVLKRIEKLQETPPSTLGKLQFVEGFFCGLDEAEVVLIQAPTADVVEIVRCNDCAVPHKKQKMFSTEKRKNSAVVGLVR